MNNKLMSACLMLACLAPLSSIAATTLAPAFSEEQANTIFEEFRAKDKPALAIALLKDGKLVYQQAFGQANLEYKVAATVDTRFQVDALAWEFIAFAVLQLEDRGKIALQDDIRKYLPDLPDLGKTITIQHLLSSTDGLYGYRVMKSLAGWQPSQAAQYAIALQLLKAQKKPNFTPGLAYSPGGDMRLVVLMRLVEAVSQQPFDLYSKEHIFAPLGMSGSAFVSDKSNTLNNVAVPYRDDGKGGYQPDYGDAAAAGPVVLYSSIRDLATWRTKNGAGVIPRDALKTRLDTPIRLDSGEMVKDISSITNYAQQHDGKERGIDKTYQTGNAGGYASSLFHFPGHGVTAITLSSGLAYNGSYGMRTAGILMEPHFTEPATIDYAKVARASLSTAQLQQHAGSYWSPERALSARIILKDNVLYYARTGGTTQRTLIPLSDNVFQMQIEGDDKYLIAFTGTGKAKQMHFSMSGSDPIVFEAHVPASYTAQELGQFTGTFHSAALNSSFVIKVSDGALAAHNLRTGVIHFKPVKPDIFVGDKSFMGGIQFSRSKGERVTGFSVMVDEVRRLEFTRIEI